LDTKRKSLSWLQQWPWRRSGALEKPKRRDNSDKMLSIAIHIRQSTSMKLSHERPLHEQVVLANLLDSVDRIVDTVEAMGMMDSAVMYVYLYQIGF
jgi:hypothetical protein